MLTCLLAFAFATPIMAEYASDPYLAYRPDFARSLPVQIMVTGVVLTLVAVLFIHLLFTAQYHWPLAPVNYVLQLSGVTTLLISLIATMHIVLSATLAESEKWPYMLSYIAVNVPPKDLGTNVVEWSMAETATWLVMNASTSGLIQITHIQFLTLLYPSRLEGRLIFTLLGPLAVVAAIVQLLPISGSVKVTTLASAVRNVCNATLSLLFTISLFVWGLLVNRPQAWRTDGGTAVFGCAALLLALLSTILNFIYIHKEDEFVWLPSLVWAVVLWQSFLGWWWWVGAGSGGGLSRDGTDEELEEKLRREERREMRKKEAKDRKRQTRMRAQKMWKGVAGAFSGPQQEREPEPVGVSSSVVLREGAGEEDDEVEMMPLRSRVRSHRGEEDEPLAQDAHPQSDSASIVSRASSITLTSSRSRPPVAANQPNVNTNANVTRGYVPNVVYRWYASLRREHNAAARLQAAERVERIRERRRRDAQEVEAEEGWAWGWGWNGLGWRRGDRRRKSLSDWERREVGYEMQRPQDENVEEEPRPPPPPVVKTRPRSVWWWGPLSRWRLQDSTTY